MGPLLSRISENFKAASATYEARIGVRLAEIAGVQGFGAGRSRKLQSATTCRKNPEYRIEFGSYNVQTEAEEVEHKGFARKRFHVLTERYDFLSDRSCDN